jgi:hypothetical protein
VDEVLNSMVFDSSPWAERIMDADEMVPSAPHLWPQPLSKFNATYGPGSLMSAETVTRLDQPGGQVTIEEIMEGAEEKETSYVGEGSMVGVKFRKAEIAEQREAMGRGDFE